jgi:uncharacterized secreted protein with C-terminal beta-propeller domain
MIRDRHHARTREACPSTHQTPNHPAQPLSKGAAPNGFSAYLHPISDGRILGVRQDATSAGHPLGTLVSLFDVSARIPSG